MKFKVTTNYVLEEVLLDRSLSSSSTDKDTIADELTWQLDKIMEEQWEEMGNDSQAELDHKLKDSLCQMDNKIGCAIQKQLDEHLDKQLAWQIDTKRALCGNIGWIMEQHLMYADEKNYRDGEHLVKSLKSLIMVTMLNEQVQKMVDQFKPELMFSKGEL
eukprot:15366312-Ditylum_brightwellii.AAC.1